MKDERKDIQIYREKLEEFHEAIQAKESNLDQTEIVYESGDLIVLKRTVRNTAEHYDPDRLYIQYQSSIHWTDAVTLRYESRYGKDHEWDIGYGSGGTVSCEPEEIAEAMKVIFADAEKTMKTQPKTTSK